MDVSDLKGLFVEVKKRMDGQLEFVRKEPAGKTSIKSRARFIYASM